MSVNFDVAAMPRSDTGKGASRRLRRQGLVPAIVYGGHQDPVMISLATMRCCAIWSTSPSLAVFAEPQGR